MGSRARTSDSKKIVVIGSSGKSGGFIAEWATPKALAPLSFKLHNQLAEEHNGSKIWGDRKVYAAEIKLQARNLPDKTSVHGSASQANTNLPPALDWLLSGSVQQYSQIGTSANSGQVNPSLPTSTLGKLANEKGVRIIIGTALRINYSEDAVSSVEYYCDGKTNDFLATDVVVAAGPWTPKLLPKVRLLTPRGHSLIVKPSCSPSPYILFPDISPAPNASFRKLISPDIYPRPPDEMYDFSTVYSSGPDGYEAPLPADADSVEFDDEQCDDVWTAGSSVSQVIHDGQILRKQACYKAQIRKHEEGEEVGPMVGSLRPRGLWLATGHDEWGIQNGPATGLVMSEMIFDGKAHSADCGALDPRKFMSE